MKITKLLPTLGALSTIVVAAPIFGSCAKSEPTDEWIDATVDVDTAGFKKIKRQDLGKDEALELYIGAISNDPSIIANDIKWGCYVTCKINEAEEDYISQKFFYKYSDIDFDKNTKTISLCFSLNLELKTAYENYDSYITFFNLDIKFNRIPISIISIFDYFSLHLMVTDGDDWLNDSSIKANGNAGAGSCKDGLTDWDYLYTFENTLTTKKNHDEFNAFALQLLENPGNWPLYYFSDCNED